MDGGFRLAVFREGKKMKFENALTAMREGKKIRHPFMPDDEYYAACYVKLPTIKDDDGNILEDINYKERGMNIVWVKGAFQHPDMRPHNWPNKQPCCNPALHDFPQLNLFLIMSDDWETIE